MSRQAWAQPTASAAIAIRPSSRIARKLRSPLPGSAEQVVARHAAVLQREAMRVAGVPAHLAVRRLDDQAGRAGRHDERADAVVGARGHGDHRRDRRAGVGDERLRAVDHPLVAGAVRLACACRRRRCRRRAR